MTRRWIAGMALLSLLAGCGSGSDPAKPDPAEPDPAKTTSTTAAAPTSFSSDAILAAMPTAKNLPGGLSLTRMCPADDEECEIYPEGLVVAEIQAEPASPVGAEQVQDQATPKDFVAVQGRLYPDASAAADETRTNRTDLMQFAGTYEVTRDDGRTSRGKGATGELKIGTWSGVAHRRTEISSDAETDKGLLIAMSNVTRGPNWLTVFVSLSAAGRDPAAAVDLADSLLRDYIERLES